METLHFHAMGCEMMVLQEQTCTAAANLETTVVEQFAAWEQALSRFCPDSELSKLNRHPGVWIEVSPTLWTVVDAAIHAAEASDGLISPTILDALEAAGYDRSFDVLQQSSPALVAIQQVQPATKSWKLIERDRERHALRLPQGVRIDLGGIAKGWAADRAVAMLRSDGPVLIDAGGDIAISGALSNGQPWTIGVAHPLAVDKDITTLAVFGGGVATSGRDYRRWQRNNVWQHHIIDPRSGQPATTDVLSATVIAPSASEAEVAAKQVLIRGSADGLRWLDHQPALAGLVVHDDGIVQYSASMRQYTLR